MFDEFIQTTKLIEQSKSHYSIEDVEWPITVAVILHYL